MSFGNTQKDGSGTAYWLLQDSDGRQIVAGAAAHDTAAAGSPVLVGGRYQASVDTVDDGDAAVFLTDTYGRQIIISAGHVPMTATQVTADGNIKASSGNLYALIVAFVGVAAGNTVIIKDGSSGSEVFRVVAAATNETVTVSLNYPIYFSTAIYADITVSSGTAYVTGVYA